MVGWECRDQNNNAQGEQTIEQREYISKTKTILILHGDREWFGTIVV